MLSVLMPAYNAERFIESAVKSVLGQTFHNFEFLVVDDCSTDSTSQILSNVKDPRIRVLRNEKNLGIVGSLNRAASEARGNYIARIDADDLCFPTRFAKQIRFLDGNPEICLLGTGIFNLEAGRISRGRRWDNADPIFIRWLMHLTNPIVHPSMMFRTDLLRQTGEYLIQDFKYAEDFEFTHRALKLGDISVLPERLVIYRLHAENVTRLHRDEMIERAGRVLARAYADLLGHDAVAEAGLVARHVMGQDPIREEATLDALGSFLETLALSFVDVHGLGRQHRETVVAHAFQIWSSIVRRATRAGFVGAIRQIHRPFHRATKTQIAIGDEISSVILGIFPAKNILAPLVRRLRVWKLDRASSASGQMCKINGVRYVSTQEISDDPPRMFVVVDTEAEFDWKKPFARDLTNVDSVAMQESAQAVFDRFGLRPIYLVDYPVASQARGYEPLCRIMARGGCAIGAHLHTWTTPPFEEDVSSLNSYGGNISPDLEERKLRTLVETIESNFQIRPRFFKAGRYGIGPNTVQTLARHGFVVDFSILPKTDLSGQGGPDFRAANPVSYLAGDHQLLSVPMTRDQIGLLAPLPFGLSTALQSPLAKSWRIPGILARLHLVNTITLTPEGVLLEEQIRLLRSMLKAGRKTFVLHYHSPSLVPGNTPYVRTAKELSIFLKRLEGVCDFFFNQFGGLPGNPGDLLSCYVPDGV
jgi:GT2 family glycosyltransferase